MPERILISLKFFFCSFSSFLSYNMECSTLLTEFLCFFFHTFSILTRVLAWFWKKMPNLGQNFFFGSAEVLGLGGLVLAFLGFPSSTLTVVGSFQKNGQVLD